MNRQEIAEESVRAMMNADGFSHWLGIEILEISPGKAVLKMQVRKEMLNGFNICHGGIPFSLADSAMAFASNSYGKISYSIENSIFYNEKILEGDVLFAEASETISNTKTAEYLVFIKKEDGSPAASFKGIVYRTEKKLINE